MIMTVRLSKNARKDLKRVPQYIALKLAAWVEAVEVRGIQEVRKISGYHDEPLRGQRSGQMSVRLSRSYRAIYEIHKDGGIEFVSIEEVTKHEY